MVLDEWAGPKGGRVNQEFNRVMLGGLGEVIEHVDITIEMGTK